MTMISTTRVLTGRERHEGFTLAELLVVISIIGVIVTVALPLLSFQHSGQLEVAAAEVGNALRFGIEGGRAGAYILVDAKTSPGRIKVVSSDATGTVLGAINDPLTKRPLDIDVSGGTASPLVSITPSFMQGGTAYKQLLIGPAGQLQVFDGPSVNMGPLQSGSNVMVSLGTPSVIVAINEITGFVTIP